MTRKIRQTGLTLPEMVLVILTIGLLVTISLPGIRSLMHSFESQSSPRALISAAMASARAIAVREQRYAGIRFQPVYRPENCVQGPQYMIFIINEPAVGAYAFRTVEGIEPIRLPQAMGVLDLALVMDRNVANPANPNQQVFLDDPSIADVQKDGWLSDIALFNDTSTFSVIFSPVGRLVRHGVWVRNKDGARDTLAGSAQVSDDIVFNKIDRVKVDASDPNPALFCQDDYYGGLANPYGNLGLGPEPSRMRLLVYDRNSLKQVPVDRRWSGYLKRLVDSQTIYLNPYTGDLVGSQ